MLIISAIPPYDFIRDEQKARKLAENLNKREVFALDTEATGLDIVRDQALYVSVAYPGYRGIFPAAYLPLFRESLEDARKIKYLWNAKFDAHMISNASGIHMQGMHDGLVMARLEDNDRRSQSLKDVTSSIFHPAEPEYVSYESPFKGRYKTVKAFIEHYGEEMLADYGSLDAWCTWNDCLRLKERLKKMDARKGRTVWDLFLEEEVPYTEILLGMERVGFQLDLEFLEEASKKAEERCSKLAYDFNRKAGKVINLRSHKQLQKFFYEELGRVPTKLTEKGLAPAVDDDVLTDWLKENEHDEYALLLKAFRKHDKLNGTYFKGLLERVDSFGRIHTTFNQAGASATFRLSSSDPNLQNIPKPQNDEYLIRLAFIASEGMDVIDADYDQVELCLIADFAQESTMLAAIREGRDLHSDAATLMFAVPYDEIMEAKKAGKKGAKRQKDLQILRDRAKTLGLGLNYGEGPKKFAHDMGITEEEACNLIDLYFSARPGLKEFMEGCSELAEEQGFVKSLSGRWMMLKQATSSNWTVSKAVSKDATNRVVQASAADVVRRAMLYCAKSDILKNCGSRLLSQVHDELIFECPKEHTEEAEKEIKLLMELPYREDLDVALSTDPGHDANWLAAKG